MLPCRDTRAFTEWDIVAVAYEKYCSGISVLS